MLSIDKYIKCSYSIPAAINLDSCWIFHLVHYTPVSFTVVKHIYNHKPVGSWRIYIIMVIGAHDSMITIQNGGQCHIWC